MILIYFQNELQILLDSVCTNGEIMNLDQVESVSLLKACIFETMRIRPVTPCGMPRAVNEKITISSYCIPKGTHIFSTYYNNRGKIMIIKTFSGDSFLDWRILIYSVSFYTYALYPFDFVVVIEYNFFIRDLNLVERSSADRIMNDLEIILFNILILNYGYGYGYKKYDL